MNGTSRIAEHVDDAWNYFYRGLLSGTVVAKALGDGELVARLYKCIGQFEAASGPNFSGRGKAET